MHIVFVMSFCTLISMLFNMLDGLIIYWLFDIRSWRGFLGLQHIHVHSQSLGKPEVIAMIIA